LRAADVYCTQTKALFYSAAVFNWAGVLILALLAQPLGLQPPQQTMFGQMALSAIFVFGCGFWMVAREPSAHRGVVVLGVFVKLLVAVIVFSHWAAGTATSQFAILMSAEIVWALLFVLFLKRTAPAHT
jgi:hypothetical protein